MLAAPALKTGVDSGIYGWPSECVFSALPVNPCPCTERFLNQVAAPDSGFVSSGAWTGHTA